MLTSRFFLSFKGELKQTVGMHDNFSLKPRNKEKPAHGDILNDNALFVT